MNEYYDPRPVLQLISDSLSEAIEKRDWSKVEDVYLQLKAELERH